MAGKGYYIDEIGEYSALPPLKSAWSLVFMYKKTERVARKLRTVRTNADLKQKENFKNLGPVLFQEVIDPSYKLR